MRPDSAPPARRRFGVCLGAAFLAAGLALPADPPATFETASGSRVVSPAVVATWIARRGSDGLAELQLLVLWRGSPGWFLRADSSGSSGGVSSGSAGDGGSPGSVVQRLSFGGIGLDLEFDGGGRTAHVQGHEVALESTNVILVDDVDGAEGPRVTDSLWVDPRYSREPAEVDVILGREPPLLAFLRCDAGLPDPQTQATIDAICARMRGQAPR